MSPDLPLPPQWSETPGPLHRALAAAITSLIHSGQLGPGAHLPTERALAQDAAVSRATVAHAYRLLKASGQIDSRQGRGTWVTGNEVGGAPAEHIAPLLAEMGDTVDLALAVPGPVAGIPSITIDAAGTGYEPAGVPGLRAAIADLFTRRGLDTAPDQILVTNGAQHALALCLGHLVDPGDQVVVEHATYVGALDVIRMVGARVNAIAVDDDGLDVGGLEAALDRHRPAAVYLNPTNQTPTGTVLAASRRRRVVSLAARSGVPVIDDATLADLGFGDPAPYLASYDRHAPVITIGSLSKVVWAGLRVGWVRADRSLIEELTARRMVDDLGGSVPSQHAAVDLIGQYDQWCAARVDELRAKHDHLVERLRSKIPEWTIPAAHGGTSVWVQLPPGADAVAFATVAAGHEVNVVPGPLVSAHGAATDRVRIAFVLPVSLLDEGVNRLTAAWGEYRSTRSPTVLV